MAKKKRKKNCGNVEDSNPVKMLVMGSQSMLVTTQEHRFFKI